MERKRLKEIVKLRNNLQKEIRLLDKEFAEIKVQVGISKYIERQKKQRSNKWN